MKRRGQCLALALCVALLAGCASHEHTWVAATCTEPKTCSKCGETDGEPLGHVWAEATCTKPKTCSVCGATEGQPNGHDWQEATCTEPQTCSVCAITEGEALGHSVSFPSCTEAGTCIRCGAVISAPGHDWQEATCTEPKTCGVCGETEGEALGHTSTSGICLRCGLEMYETASGYGDDVVSGLVVGDGIYRLHFSHSGSSNFIVKSYDADNDRELLINEIGRYDGYVLLLGSSPYSLEITADGPWSYTVERLAAETTASFSGKGDYVTGVCDISTGVWQFTHDGSSNFVVRVYTADGRDLLVNEIGAYSGKKVVEIPSGSNAFFEITANGNWTAAPVE